MIFTATHAVFSRAYVAFAPRHVVSCLAHLRFRITRMPRLGTHLGSWRAPMTLSAPNGVRCAPRLGLPRAHV